MSIHNNKFSLLLLLALLVIPLATAQQLVFKQATEVDLKVPVFFNGTIADGTATCNITIFEPDGDTLINNQLMTNQNVFHNYTLTAGQTTNVGEHETSVFCSQGSNNGFSTFNYLISPSGTDDNSIGQIILLTFGVMFSAGFIWFGFNRGDPIFALFGGLALVSVSLYTLLNGVAVYRNELTEGISLLVMGVASYVSIRTSMEMING
jgi:hypothetical protein